MQIITSMKVLNKCKTNYCMQCSQCAQYIQRMHCNHNENNCMPSILKAILKSRPELVLEINFSNYQEHKIEMLTIATKANHELYSQIIPLLNDNELALYNAALN